MSRPDPYAGAVAVVTGAASGIGRALCAQLAQRGAHVVAADLAGDGADIQIVDVADPASVDQLIQGTVARHGVIDYVFNNAGIFAAGPFEELADAALHKLVDVNLWGVVHGTRAAYSQMRAQGHGHIVNTASSAGVMPVADGVAYAATKHAVVGLSSSLRAEAAGSGVKVSVAVPGLVDTGIFGKARELTGVDYEKKLERLPFAKISPEAAAAAILDGAARNRQYIVFPRYNRVLVRLNRLMPDLMARVVNA